MHSQTHYRLRLRTLVLSLVVLAAMLVIGVVVVSAVDPFPGLPNDGRVNVVHHFGGDALYCVDRDMNPTDQFSDDNFGGIRLLNIHGQELWFVPAADIEAAIVIAQATPGLGVEVITAPGTYGPSYLYVFADPGEDGDIKFQFTAYDEWGKTNMMEFKFCEPVGPTGTALETTPDEPICGEPERSDEFCECAFDFCFSQHCPLVDVGAQQIIICDKDALDQCLEDIGANEFCAR
jgi:hypothetical protein